jgi:hypothetical protein
MSSDLTCPACQGEVPVPQSAAELACPHCGVELRLALQLAADIPPLQRPRPVAASTPATSPPKVTAAQVRRALQPSQKPSALGQMAGILMGGALGMVVGYWILNYLGGPRFNFLDVPLPWVPHTQKAKAAPAPPPHHAPPASALPFMEEEEPPPRRAIEPAPPQEPDEAK